SGRSSCAAVLRNKYGLFICARTGLSDIQSPTTAETSGFLMAIMMAVKLNFKKIIIEGDAPKVVEALNGGLQPIPWRLIHFVEKIKQLVSKFDQVEFSFIPREANEVSHQLGNYAFKHNIHQWWISSPPPCISSYLSMDEV
ncbi:hypothetical protein MKX01_030993, partial [Papaver californicum]